MADPNERLRAARERAGYKTPADAARRHGWNPNTYKSHENGLRRFHRVVTQYARGFRVSASWLLGLSDEGGPKESSARGEQAAPPSTATEGAEVPIDQEKLSRALQAAQQILEGEDPPDREAAVVQLQAAIYDFLVGEEIGTDEDVVSRIAALIRRIRRRP